MGKDSEDKSMVLNFLAGLGLGALIGAVTALLLAPQSGKETRDDLREAAEELKMKANKVVQDLSESSEELVKKTKEALQATKEKVGSAIETGKQVFKKNKEEMAEEGEQA